jgi:DNA uptake protein ComE-like DNA-binding protein
MKHLMFKALAITLALSGFHAVAATPATPTAPDETRPKIHSTRKPRARVKPDPATLVDINSASKAELKKLPNVDDATADKIIAGRPYLSKSKLVTRDIIPRLLYEGLKTKIIAKQDLRASGAPKATVAKP